MERTRGHLCYIDYLRAAACLCVVYMHTASGALYKTVGGAGWILLSALASFSFCAVPLFFMISGYLLLSSRKTASVSVLFKKRLPRLIVPLAVWTLIDALWRMYSEKLTFGGFASRLFSAVGEPIRVHFWFMYALVALYLISPFLYGALHSLGRAGHILLVCLCIGVLIYKSVSAILAPSVYGCFMPGSLRYLSFMDGNVAIFILGYYAGNIKKRIPSAVLASFVVLLTLFITLMTCIESNRAGVYVQSWQTQSAFLETALAASVFLFFRQCADRDSLFRRTVIKPIATLAFPIYLMHNTLLAVFEAMGMVNGRTLNALLMTLLVFVCCYIALKVISTIKPLCFAFCGMSYPDACKSCNFKYTFSRK